MKKLLLASCMAVALSLGACGGAPSEEPAPQEQEEASQATQDDAQAEGDKDAVKDEEPAEDDRLDLLVLVNKDHALPDGWEDDLELVETENIKGDVVSVDTITNDAFVALQEELEEKEGITIQQNSGYRSVEQQQAIWDEFMEDYGEDYVLEYVAVPGHSEHHTGLALDALLVEDGVPIVTNEDIFAREDTWEVIHSYLAKHGFILRYLDGQEDITGYTYEPWHIRYVGKEAATEIMDKGITLEEYLGEV